MRTCPKCGKQFPEDVAYCSVDGTWLVSAEEGGQLTGDTGERPAGTVLGSYRLLKVLGMGGMGRVYLAEHTKLGRKVALKALRSEHASNQVAIRRFFQEARSVNRIRHENIVEITDFIEDPGGDNYYIMELLEGWSLTRVLEEEGFVEAHRAIRIAIQVAGALAAVHKAGIIHRDMKPDNIYLIRRAGRKDFVKLLDFGVAKLLETQTEKPLHQTGVGAILGTPEYMSPEQAGGKRVDHRTDVYSLGVILYQMVTGKKPFEAQSYGEMVIKHITIPPTPPRQLPGVPQEVPEELEALILSCLEKDPARRPQRMIEVVGKLAPMVGEEPPPEPVLPPEMPLATQPMRKPGRTAGLLAGIAGLIVLVGLGVRFGFMEVEGPDEARADRPARSSPDAGVAPDAGNPALASAENSMVRISFETTPPGARVLRAGGVKTLGRTPCSLEFKRTGEKRDFEFMLAGFQPARRAVTLNQDHRVEVKLNRRPGGKRRKLLRKKKKTDPSTDPAGLDPGGTINPFEEP